MRLLYAYDVNKWYPSDDWLKTGWAGDSQTRTRLVDSVLYHVFVSKQCILCSALRHKGYLTLPYTLHRFGIHSTRNFRARLYQAAASQLRVLSRRGCSLAIMFKEDYQILKFVFKMLIRIQFVLFFKSKIMFTEQTCDTWVQAEYCFREVSRPQKRPY